MILTPELLTVTRDVTRDFYTVILYFGYEK